MPPGGLLGGGLLGGGLLGGEEAGRTGGVVASVKLGTKAAFDAEEGAATGVGVVAPAGAVAEAGGPPLPEAVPVAPPDAPAGASPSAAATAWSQSGSNGDDSTEAGGAEAMGE